MFKVKRNLNLKIRLPKRELISSDHYLDGDSRQTINEIVSNIYIGGYLIAQNKNILRDKNFTHIINCAGGNRLTHSEPGISGKSTFKRLIINLRDDPSSDIICPIFLVINFIESNKNKIKNILFHCIEGVSRAPALLAGYLMWKNNFTKEQAINFIQSKRNCVDIKLCFIIQLEKWECYLRNIQEISMFRMSKNILLLDDFELKNGKNFELNENEFLIRIKGRLFVIKNEKKNLNNEKFISYVKRYDKNLIKGLEIIELNNFNGRFIDLNQIMDRILSKF